MNRKGIEKFVCEEDAIVDGRARISERLELYLIGIFVEALFDALTGIHASFINQVTRGRKGFREILLQSLQKAVREMAFARARFKDCPSFRRTKFLV